MQYEEPDNGNEAEKSANKGPVCYRRDLNAPKPDVVAETAALPASKSDFSMKQIVCIAGVGLVFVFLIFVIVGFHIINSVATELAAEQKRAAVIKVVGWKDFPDTIQVVNLLKIYGFNVEFWNQPMRFKTMPSQDEAMKLAAPKITLANGKKISAALFYITIVTLKPVNFNAATPANSNAGVILYGIQNCIYTDKAKEMLDRKGIRYTFVDLNTDAGRYLGELGAKLIVSGYDFNERGYHPLLEYNNHVYSRATIYDTISKMQVSQ